MPITIKEILEHAMDYDAKYQIRYVDYKPGTWTAPVLLTPERIEDIMSDFSVEKIIIEIELK